MKIFNLIMALVILIALPSYGEAYVGPGLGLGVVGAVIGVIVAIFLAFIGILWYPIKRFILRNSSQGNDADQS